MPYLEVVFQTFLAFFALLIYARLLGKQQIGQLTFFEYVNGITFGSIAAVLATDVSPERTGLHFLGLTIFAALTYFIGYLALLNRPLRKVVSGEPTVVVHNGKILEQAMKKMRYNLDELNMQLREAGYFNVADVEYAILEPNGNLSVLPKTQQRHVTPADLGIPTVYEGIASEIIMDGQVIYPNLQQNGLDEKWLLNELQRLGISDLKQVVLASLDSKGRLYVDLRQDSLTSPRDITDLPKPPQPPLGSPNKQPEA